MLTTTLLSENLGGPLFTTLRQFAGPLVGLAGGMTRYYGLGQGDEELAKLGSNIALGGMGITAANMVSKVPTAYKANVDLQKQQQQQAELIKQQQEANINNNQQIDNSDIYPSQIKNLQPNMK